MSNERISYLARLTPDRHTGLKNASMNLGVSMNELINRALDETVVNWGYEPKEKK